MRGRCTVRHVVQQMLGCLLEMDEAHEPEIMPIHRRNLDVLVRRILTQCNWIHGGNLDQRDHNLQDHNPDSEALEMDKSCGAVVYLVVAPGLLTGGCREGEGPIAAECDVDVGEVEGSRDRSGGGREVASKRLLQPLGRIGLEGLLVERLEAALGEGFRCQAQLPHCCLGFGWCCLHCHNISIACISRPLHLPRERERERMLTVVPNVVGEVLCFLSPGVEEVQYALHGAATGASAHRLPLQYVGRPFVVASGAPKRRSLVLWVRRWRSRWTHQLRSPLGLLRDMSRFVRLLLHGLCFLEVLRARIVPNQQDGVVGGRENARR